MVLPVLMCRYGHYAAGRGGLPAMGGQQAVASFSLTKRAAPEYAMYDGHYHA